jgi:NADH-quinone oxidoreductase subunit L
MFLACGLTAYSAGVFHLMTHAFFKALLFLAAGAIIHAIDGEQDLRKMGGLWNKMPFTFTVTTIGVLAIAGVPPLAGFFSKDAIIEAALQEGPLGVALGCAGLLIAVLTTLYMFRMWYMAFLGVSRGGHKHPHQTSWWMNAPLAALALLTICGGWMGMNNFDALLRPVFGVGAVDEYGAISLLAVLTVVLAALGWGAADLLYRLRPDKPQAIAAEYPLCYRILVNKYYVDELYQMAIVKPLLQVSKYAFDWVIDRALLGGVVWLLAGAANFAGALLQPWQSGNLRTYAAWLAAGAAALLLFVFFAHVWIPTAVLPLPLPLNLGGR